MSRRFAPPLCVVAAVTAGLITGASAADTSGWVRAEVNTNRPVWGIRGGLIWGIPSGKTPGDGPRGLIRLWSPVLPAGEYDLVNFIAVEPITGNQKGFSELEWSALDDVQGKRLWVESADLDPAGEQLSVRIGVERFQNGAAIGLTVIQRAHAPEEISIEIHLLPDSAPLDYCVLTATMGNKARARQLWLASETLSSLKIYPDYRDIHFAPHHIVSADRLHRTVDGGLMAAITTDERDPAAVDPSPAARHWRYRGAPVTQFWKKPAGAWRGDLHVAINARYTYWMSRHPIPGGISIENFEMRERSHPGQRFIFGITRHTPLDLGFKPSPPSTAPRH